MSIYNVAAGWLKINSIARAEGHVTSIRTTAQRYNMGRDILIGCIRINIFPSQEKDATHCGGGVVDGDIFHWHFCLRCRGVNSHMNPRVET